MDFLFRKENRRRGPLEKRVDVFGKVVEEEGKVFFRVEKERIFFLGSGVFSLQEAETEAETVSSERRPRTGVGVEGRLGGSVELDASPSSS